MNYDLDNYSLTREVIDQASEIVSKRLDKFDFVDVPSEKAFKSIWWKHRDAQAISQKRTGGPKARDLPQLDDLIQQSDSGKRITVREMAQRLGCSHSTVLARMKKHKVRFYRRRRVEFLKENHIAARLKFAKLMHHDIQHKLFDPNDIIFTDESMICVGPQQFGPQGLFQHKNSSNRDQVLLHKSCHPAKIHVFCALSAKKGIIGPYFIDEIDGPSPILNAAKYQKLITDHVEPELRIRLGTEFERAWWQQDGAPSHTSQNSVDLLNKLFNGRVISKNCSRFWPAFSPDLNPLDYWFWSLLKRRLGYYTTMSVESTKRRIREICNSITADDIKAAISNWDMRLVHCMQNNGAHFEHTWRQWKTSINRTQVCRKCHQIHYCTCSICDSLCLSRELSREETVDFTEEMIEVATGHVWEGEALGDTAWWLLEDDEDDRLRQAAGLESSMLLDETDEPMEYDEWNPPVFD